MKTSDSAEDLALSTGERNPLKIDGELSRDGSCTSSAIPFKGENVALFMQLLDIGPAVAGGEV